VSPRLTQPLVLPGETFVYEFVAERPAVGMYHAHTHGQMAVPNGLFGVILIGDVPIPDRVTIGGHHPAR
jgi:manganese oxidase